MTFTESFKLTGNNILQRIAELIKKGNAKRVRLKNKHGRVLLDTTLTIGSAGAGWAFMVSPIMVVISGIVLVVSEVQLEIDYEVSDEHEIPS